MTLQFIQIQQTVLLWHCSTDGKHQVCSTLSNRKFGQLSPKCEIFIFYIFYSCINKCMQSIQLHSHSNILLSIHPDPLSTPALSLENLVNFTHSGMHFKITAVSHSTTINKYHVRTPPPSPFPPKPEIHRMLNSM